MQLSEIRQRLIDFYGNTFSEDTEFYNRVINDVYQEVCSLAEWHWLQRQRSWRLSGTVKTVETTLTAGSGNVTFASAPGDHYAGGWLSVPAEADQDGIERVYRLVSVSGTSGGLDQSYIGTSGAFTCHIWNDWIYEQDVETITSVVVQRNPAVSIPLTEVGPDWFAGRRSIAWRYASSQPTHYCLYRDRDRFAAAIALRFWPPVTQTVELQFHCRVRPAPLSADTDEPYVPERYHGVLVAGGIMRLAKIAREDPDVVAQWQAEYDRHLRHLWRDQLASVTEPRRFGRRKRKDIRVKIVHPTASAGDWP